MKILYVKNNSERSTRFQLRTIIYEKDGIKYVKKQAANKEAITHLKQIKENYKKLQNSIIDSKIKLAKIIDEDKNSLTFEYIEGVSLDKMFHDALEHGDESIYQLINTYIDILTKSFKTSTFDPSSVDTDFRKMFGHNDYTKLKGLRSFSGIANIDLIFSNLLFSNGDIYILDYEWVFNHTMPIDFIIFRQFENFTFPDKIRKDIYSKLGIDNLKHIFTNMNRNFILKYVTDPFSSYQYIHNYRKTNVIYLDFLKEKDKHIDTLNQVISEQTESLSNLTQSMHFKSRAKRKIKTVVPHKIWNYLRTIKHGEEVQHDVSENKNAPVPFVYSYKVPVITHQKTEHIKNFKNKPLISIIMPVYNVSPKWLDLAIKSIEDQWYENWELCIADDKSTNKDIIVYLNNIDNPKIKITFLDTNLNISGASNAALNLSTGNYIALMDNDDEITPNALYEIVKAINEQDAEFIYSDEDFISPEGECSNPHFKPNFSPDLLLSHNYITHFTCFKRELLDTVGSFNSKFDGAQDYDLFLRLTEKTSKIYHIQKVLYHWRTLPSSTSSDSTIKPEALDRGKQVLEASLKRRHINASVEHGNLNHYFRVRYEIPNDPLVSIIIPFKDKPELLRMCINSILEKSTYGNYEIIGISNNSTEEDTFNAMRELEENDPRVSFYEYNIDFNYSKINNYAVQTYAKGEHVILLNNDIEIISPEWIESMLELSQRENIGCVGAKLYYPNDTIQHAGIIIGLGGYAGHSHKHYVRDSPGYFNRLHAIQNLSAVTAACLMVKKSIYTELNGFNEIDFKVAYNDVDFCLRVLNKGYLNVFTPFAEAYHHESLSRGYETTPEKIARFDMEKVALIKEHHHILTHGDPYYNPGLTLDKEDFGLCQTPL